MEALTEEVGVAQAARAAGLGLKVPLALGFEQVASDVYEEDFLQAR